MLSHTVDNPHRAAQIFAAGPSTLGASMPEKKPGKMPPRVEDPGYWRFRAGNARKQSEEVKYPEGKTILLNVAEQYERLAQLAEELKREARALRYRSN